MHDPDAGTASLHVPYDPAFIARVALEAHAQPRDAGLLARPYGVPERLVAMWHGRLVDLAEAFLMAPLPAVAQPASAGHCQAAGDVRIAALDEMDVSIAVLEGPELRYRYANRAYI